MADRTSTAGGASSRCPGEAETPPQQLARGVAPDRRCWRPVVRWSWSRTCGSGLRSALINQGRRSPSKQFLRLDRTGAWLGGQIHGVPDIPANWAQDTAAVSSYSPIYGISPLVYSSGLTALPQPPLYTDPATVFAPPAVQYVPDRKSVV